MKDAKNRRRRLALPAIAAVAIGATACSSDSGADWSADAVVIVDGDAFEVDPAVARTPSVSPDGRMLAFVDGDRICVQPLDDARPDCAVGPEGLSELTMSWSDDGSTLLLTHDFTRFLVEPDVVRVDVESLDVDVLTDDRADEPYDDQDALLDQAPFVGPDGAVHFFRSDANGRADFELFRFDDDGRDASDAEQVGSLDLPSGMIPVAPVYRVDDDRWALVGLGRDTSVLLIIDFDANEISELDLDADRPALIDIAGGLALVADIAARARQMSSYSLIDLDTGRNRDIDPNLDGVEQLNAAGFSPDGSSIVVLVGDFASDESELWAIPIEDRRSQDDEPVTLVDRRDFEDFVDDGRSRVFGVGAAGEIVWNDDGTIALFAPDSHLIRFETTPG